MGFLSRGIVAGFLLVAAVSLCATEEGVPTAPCAKEVRLTGHEYWLYEMTVGVDPGTESGDDLSARALGPPPFDVCFRVPVAEVKDASERTKGYVEAIGRLTLSLTENVKTWDTDPRSLEVRAKIEAVTGQKFKTPAEFGRWYEDKDYVRWSDEKMMLVLDVAAKKARKRITELDVSELSSESYWTLEGSGHLSESGREAGFVRGKYWDGFQERRFKILATALDDRAAREAGYRKAARSLAHQLERHRSADAAWTSLTLKRYQELTGQRFASPQDCIAWCDANCSRLHLAPDGEHLTLFTVKEK